ncbi:hypothetical protein HU200_000646 [Digitaria exilis]|uniref:Uncharacterized protein n=1 Tax=Digitaria exilis TaxID=1010633 RepID=A0A835G1U9_9POAL|nr:hypothetical protein HU200_000646 [Digitaria exilis]
MEELGRDYLNELINRSLVKPTKVGADGATVKECRVHDVTFEFIISKAKEHNFVTIWNRNRFSENYPSNEIRRLSIQLGGISGTAEEMAKTIKNAAHIRSINIFGSNLMLVKHASKFLSSQVLRVLNIDQDYAKCYLEPVKTFGQMKYLRIAGYLSGCKLPENIEKLQHLETLVVGRSHIIGKPLPSIIQLQKLVRLRVSCEVQLPNGIGGMQALEQLSKISLGIQSVKVIQELGNLTNLKVLGINWQYYNGVSDVEGHKKTCILSLSKLFMGLRELRVWGHETLSFRTSCAHTSPPLQKLVLHDSLKPLSMVPRGISSLVNLTRLSIALGVEVSKEGIDILARLPKLVSLTVLFIDKERDSSRMLHPRHAINSQGFRHLVKFNFTCWLEMALEFMPGAMPKLQRLKLELKAWCQFKYVDGGLVPGMQNLTGLRHLALRMNCDAATTDVVQALEDNIRDAADAHPNRPILHVEKYKTGRPIVHIEKYKSMERSGLQQATYGTTNIVRYGRCHTCRW